MHRRKGVRVMSSGIPPLADNIILAVVKVIVWCMWCAAALAFRVAIYLLIGVAALLWGLRNVAGRKPFSEGIHFPHLEWLGYVASPWRYSPW